MMLNTVVNLSRDRINKKQISVQVKYKTMPKSSFIQSQAGDGGNHQ